MAKTYDIIGDVHGRASVLLALLGKLGYQRQGKRWSQGEDRQLIFLGDLIDVGPQQRETLMTIRELIDSSIAQCVMGNHEFNAICYATPNASNAGDYLRSHREPWGQHNQQQHQAFLSEFAPSSADSREWINWMLDLPLWIEIDELRVVHACWNQETINRLSTSIPRNRLSPDQLASACDETTTLGADVAMLLKGPELPLPANLTFLDRSGHTRDHVRRAWWRTPTSTYGAAALPSAGVVLPTWGEPLPPELSFSYTESIPTFFGHYCFVDMPLLVGRRTVCLDSCVARDHHLTAYRWSGETDLTPDHIISVSGASGLTPSRYVPV